MVDIYLILSGSEQRKNTTESLTAPFIGPSLTWDLPGSWDINSLSGHTIHEFVAGWIKQPRRCLAASRTFRFEDTGVDFHQSLLVDDERKKIFSQ